MGIVFFGVLGILFISLCATGAFWFVNRRLAVWGGIAMILGFIRFVIVLFCSTYPYGPLDDFFADGCVDYNAASLAPGGILFALGLMPVLRSWRTFAWLSAITIGCSVAAAVIPCLPFASAVFPAPYMLWHVLTAGVLFGWAWKARVWRHLEAIDSGICPRCGYQADGGGAQRLCPECGAPQDRSFWTFVHAS